MPKTFHVYLVEDDPDDHLLLAMAFEKGTRSTTIERFENGRDLYQKLIEDTESEQWPHLILLDLNLPVWNGKKTLEMLKTHERLKTIPVVIYTTSHSAQDTMDSYRLGANSYIVKPAKFESLLETVNAISHYWFDVVRFSKPD